MEFYTISFAGDALIPDVRPFTIARSRTDEGYNGITFVVGIDLLDDRHYFGPFHVTIKFFTSTTPALVSTSIIS